MTFQIDRFQVLADAWGPRVDAWPPAEQAYAFAFIQAHPQVAQAALEAAEALDAALDALPAPHPSPALRAAVLAAAPQPRNGLAGWLQTAGARFGPWVSGAGLAAACAAGVVCGVAVTDGGGRDARAAALLQAASDVGASVSPTAEAAPSSTGGKDV